MLRHLRNKYTETFRLTAHISNLYLRNLKACKNKAIQFIYVVLNFHLLKQTFDT